MDHYDVCQPCRDLSKKKHNEFKKTLDQLIDAPGKETNKSEISIYSKKMTENPKKIELNEILRNEVVDLIVSNLYNEAAKNDFYLGATYEEITNHMNHMDKIVDGLIVSISPKIEEACFKQVNQPWKKSK